MKTFGFYLISMAVAFIVGGKIQKPKEKIVYKYRKLWQANLKKIKLYEESVKMLQYQNQKGFVIIEDLKTTNKKLEQDLELCLEREKRTLYGE